MRTTFELQRRISYMEKKLILENLRMIENIWGISVDIENAVVSFEYMSSGDLKKVRRELHELGYHVINDTHRFDHPDKFL